MPPSRVVVGLLLPVVCAVFACGGSSGNEAGPSAAAAGVAGVPNGLSACGASSGAAGGRGDELAGVAAGGVSAGGVAGASAISGSAGNFEGGGPAGGDSAGQPGDVGPSGIRHPGLLTSLADLAAIKQHLANGDEPWKTELTQLQTRAAARKLHTPPSDRKIFCGGYNLDENGQKILECDYAVENGIDAYTLALLGYLKSDSTMSEQAIQFIMAWADNFQGFDPVARTGAQGNNALLQAGWTAPWYANAAEILRYTYSSWTADHTRRATKLLKVLLPEVENDAVGASNNWLHSRIEAHISIAIFVDDKAMFAAALADWKANTPSYFYIDSDGSLPPKPHRNVTDAALASTWDTPTYISGMTMETCRDLNHQQLGVRSIFNSLAMARTQSIDVLTGNDIRERLTTFLEQQAVWMLAKKAPAGACNQPIVVQPGTPPLLMDAAQPVPFEMAFKLLYGPSQTLPNARAAIVAKPSTGAARWVQKWETLTHHLVPAK